MSPRITKHRGHRGVGVAFLVLSLLATRLGAQGKNVGPSPEDTVRALESARGEALLKADTTALSRMTANEFVEVSRFGTLRTKADNLREIATGALQLKSVRYDSTSVRIYGDVAILRAIADNTGTYRGFPFAGRLWYTRIFVRHDGRWQAVAMQHTMIQ